MKEIASVKDLTDELLRLGFQENRTQDGLEGLKLVSYVKDRITLEVYEWPGGDWDVGRAYGPKGELENIQPELVSLMSRTALRRRRLAFSAIEASGV